MYFCSNCGYESSKFFGLCPKCHIGTGEEKHENLELQSQNQYRNRFGIAKTNVLEKIKPVDKNSEKLKASRITDFKDFNAILSSSNGFIDGQMIALAACPGVGKSTLCTAIASNDTLYISSEENWNQVNNRTLRVNPNCNMDILSTTSFDEVCDAIRNTDKKFIIIDSLNSIEFGVGYTTTARFASELTDLIKEYNKICIMICQVTKNGEIAGMQSLVHVVDTVLHMERSEISSNIILTSSKNRFGEIGSIAVFRHLENGFEELPDENVSIENIEPEIGLTYSKTRFGYKTMQISIESLVANSVNGFGLRKSNGYNQNRLIQIIGILSYYGKIDLTSKDIYVAIGNGLYVDGDIGIELAIANSILSSYYRKSIIKSCYGEIKLNGKIINNSSNPTIIDYNNNKIKIKHIDELIKYYKEK